MKRRNRRMWTAVLLGLILGLAGGILVSQVRETHDSYWAPLGGHLTTMAAGGGLVAFMSTRSGMPEIWIMRSDGAFPTQLTATNDGYWKSRPQVSIDGRWIVYTSDHDNDGFRDAFVLGIDGSNLTRVTDAASRSHDYEYAAWHPSCRAIILDDVIGERLYSLDVDDPPYAGTGVFRAIEPNAPGRLDPGGSYIDELGSVGSGSLLELEAERPDFWEARSCLFDERSCAWIYVRGDACYQCGIGSSCGLSNFPLTISVSSNPSDHFLIDRSPQYIDPDFFGGSWTGETGHLQFALGDTNRDDNCGSYTVWIIPHPTWGGL